MEDTFYPLLKAYRSLPSFAQNAIGRSYRAVPARVRYGAFYQHYRQRVSLFLGSDADACRTRQVDLLRETVNRAIAHVPFYTGLRPITTPEDFQQIPVVSKGDIVADPMAFVSGPLRSRALEANTGGSSGTPMAFLLHRGKTRPKERAHFDWFWGLWGYRPGARVLMVRGAPLKGNSLYEHQTIKNCLAVSCYDLNRSNVDRVLDEARRFGPRFIHGYPSAVKNFFRCIAESPGARWDLTIKALFLGSEGLAECDREEIEQFTKAKVVSWYGHSECATMGGNTPDSNEFHFYPFYGYTELLDDHGDPVQEPGEIGRIVATSFDNLVMPFIRYDTGDRGVLSSRDHVYGMPCLALSKIEGRVQDVVYLSDGTRVSLTAFIFGQHLPEFSRIREMQLVQSECGKLTIRIVRGSGYVTADTERMVNRLQQSVSQKMMIACEFVERIEKTHRGKQRFLVQTCECPTMQCSN